MKHPAQKTEALHRQAIASLAAGRLAEGVAQLRQLLAAGAETAEIHNDLGAALMQAGRAAEAEKHFARAVAMSPANAQMAMNYARLLKRLRGPAAARDALLQALKTNSRAAALWSELGLAHAALEDRAQAIAALKKSVTLDAQQPRAWVSLLHYEEAENRLDDARETLAAAHRAYPSSSPEIALQEAKLLRREGRIEDAAALLRRFEGAISPRSAHYSAFFFELGRLLDRAEDAPGAFAAYEKANAALQQATAAGNHHHFTALLARIAKDLPANMTAASAPPLAQGYPQPVFLVGFPRSGTTLLDQILSSYDGVRVAEEKPALHDMIECLGVIHREKTGVQKSGDAALGFFGDAAYPSCIASLDDADIARLRGAFLAAHEKFQGVKGARVFVDKLPLNMMHAALIRRVFPGAKFILALRHPCDAVLSCFMQGFGANHAMSHFYRLDDAARFYDAVFSLWHACAVPPPDVHPIRYEDVVADFRGAVGALLGFLGLPWDDCVLEYDKTARARGGINTPSYHQVTEKIYTRASGRWLKYRAQMAPVLDILAPHAARLGYDMDDAGG